MEQEVEERLRPFHREVARLCTIPGLDRVTAWGLLAEIGLNMNHHFPMHGSWLVGRDYVRAITRARANLAAERSAKGSLWLCRCWERLGCKVSLEPCPQVA